MLVNEKPGSAFSCSSTSVPLFPLKKSAVFPKDPNMGYVFDFKDARAYERWLLEPKNRYGLQLQTRVVFDLLHPLPGETLLDIGCGTGFHLSAFVNQHLRVTGLDPSPYMLDIAARSLGNRADLHRGIAEDLPFDDNSFNHACLITTLEFTEDPQQALQEAFRVAKDRVVVGILNRYALKGLQRRIQGIFTPCIYNRARFFSVWEIKRMTSGLVGEVPVTWRTVCQLPFSSNPVIGRIEASSLVQRCPFGTFAALSVTLTPRFRTRPLPLEYRPKHTTSPLTG